MGLKRQFHFEVVSADAFAPYMGLKSSDCPLSLRSEGFAPYMGLKRKADKIESKIWLFAPYMGLKSLYGLESP